MQDNDILNEITNTNNFSLRKQKTSPVTSTTQILNLVSRIFFRYELEFDEITVVL